MRATASTLEGEHTDGCGRARSARPWCLVRRGQGRRLPWSYPIFCSPKAPSSRRRRSPTSCVQRRRRWRGDGWALLYDPSGEVECPHGVERVGWSPLTTASSWDAAVVTADAMVAASRMGTSRAGEHHWTERAGALLSTLLHAAATERLPMPEFLHWIERHNAAPALEILSAGPKRARRRPMCSPGSWLPTPGSSRASGPPHRACWGRTAPVGPWRRRSRRPSTSRPSAADRTPCTSARRAGASSNSRRSWWRRSATSATPPMHEPATGVPGRRRSSLSTRSPTSPQYPDLPTMVSEGAGQGLLVLACLQDLSQARVRWRGSAADGFLSLSGPRSSCGGSPTVDAPRHRRARRRPGGGGDDGESFGRSLGTHPPLPPPSGRAPGSAPRRCCRPRHPRARPRPRPPQGRAVELHSRPRAPAVARPRGAGTPASLGPTSPRWALTRSSRGRARPRRAHPGGATTARPARAASCGGDRRGRRAAGRVARPDEEPGRPSGSAERWRPQQGCGSGRSPLLRQGTS